MTIAADIAAKLDNDPYRFRNDDTMETLWTLATAQATSTLREEGYERWDFNDGSCLVSHDAHVWGLGFPESGCFCFADSGHDHACTANHAQPTPTEKTMTQTDTTTDTTTDTIADTIAETLCSRFGNDGQAYERLVIDEETGEECVESAVDVFEDWAVEVITDSDQTKYIFRDASTIVECGGGGYDIGFAGCDCFCWEGAGHHENCESA